MIRKDAKRLDVILSAYKRTTDIFSEFRRANDITVNPFYVDYVYDTLYLKDFMTISIKINGKTSNYQLGFLVKHCDYWDKESQEKRKTIEYGILMSELKKDYYKKLFFETTEESIIKNIFEAVSQYVQSGRKVNETVIPFNGFELYAQDGYSRRNPGAGVEYGETDVYLVDEVVVDKVGLVWED